MTNSILIYDIETKTFGRPDGNKDELKFFGCYSYKTKKYYLLTNKEDIRKALKSHKFLVGFNNKYYDDLVLKRSGFGSELYQGKCIDLREIIKNRAGVISIKEGLFNNIMMHYSLDYITKKIGLVSEEEGKIKDFDYNILKKDTWTKEELDLINTYTERDIMVTKKLYEWVEDYFAAFKEFMTDDDVENKEYLTCSVAKFCYKAICKFMGWGEQYGGEDGTAAIAGGYVAYPAGEKFKGKIYCLDFNSLYPHIMIQCNLFGRKKGLSDKPVWYGNGTWKVEGAYFSDELSGVGLLLRNLYLNRLFYKRQVILEDGTIIKMSKIDNSYIGKKYKTIKDNKLITKEITEDELLAFEKLVKDGVDKREYTIKIIINTIYGILNNPYYTLVFDKTAGGDCTRLGRQWTKYARKTFKEAGYIICYTDTDSVYLEDPFNDEDKLMKVKQKIIDKIKETVPFPQETFDMGIDDRIKHMFFFKGKLKEDTDLTELDEDDLINRHKGLMKKNYIYVTEEDKVVVKNLGIKKKNISGMTKKIFWEHLVPKIKEGEHKFSKVWINELIKTLINDDISLVSMRKEVGPIEQYERSPNSLPAQLSKKYGPGIHMIFPIDKNLGVGKGKHYCNDEDFEKFKLTTENINLDNVWKELEYFIKPVQVKNIFDF